MDALARTLKSQFFRPTRNPAEYTDDDWQAAAGAVRDAAAATLSRPWLAINEIDGVEVYAAMEAAIAVLRAVGNHVMADHYQVVLDRLRAGDGHGRKEGQ
jgi:hypothetical protein